MRSLSKLCVFTVVLLAGATTLFAQNLPPEIKARLIHAGIPEDAIALYVADAAAPDALPFLAHRAHQFMHPASGMKLVTTMAAFELLGLDYRWQTQVLVRPRAYQTKNAPASLSISDVIENGVLRGDLVIKGGGDPKFLVEDLWLLLQRVRGLSIHMIDGDIVLDHSLFERLEKTAADFDGEPLRPYNVLPDALLIHFQTAVLTFTPQLKLGVAWVDSRVPLAGHVVQRQVPLVAGACGDYRAALKLNLNQANRWRFEGAYPASCGERTWSVAYQPSHAFAAGVVAGVWQLMGAGLTGTVRSVRGPLLSSSDQALGKASAVIKDQGVRDQLADQPAVANEGDRVGDALWSQQPVWPIFSVPSHPLVDVVRDINKFSNNVMAQQVFLSLGWADYAGQDRLPVASFSVARQVVRQWWQARFGHLVGMTPPLLDNGSGLSRTERISAYALARLLQSAYAAPYGPEFLASLPQTGQEGTQRHERTQATAFLKTGSLVDVVSRAGYVFAKNGRRYVLVLLVNSDQPAVLASSREFIRYLIEWTAAQDVAVFTSAQ